jgi:hypothetical protein
VTFCVGTAFLQHSIEGKREAGIEGWEDKEDGVSNYWMISNKR